MEFNEFKDRLFDIINDTDELTINDIVVNDRGNNMKVQIADGSQFLIRCEREEK